MEENTTAPSPNVTDQSNNYSPGTQLMVGVSVVLVLAVIGFFGYTALKGNSAGQSSTNQPVLGASTNQLSPPQTITQSPQNIAQAATTAHESGNTNVPSSSTNKTCSKNGPAQKWEYLTPYVVKDGDSLQSIATSQLNDASRVNEIMQINGQGPYVVGSTLYLPPSFITKSTGNLKEVYGLLTAKDASYWHINYSSDPNGIGIIIPTFWFGSVAGSDSLTVGDCIKVLFDDGNKVFSASLQ